jgi:hypothetical protein
MAKNSKKYKCTTGAHEWSNEDDAAKCCNGWIAKWVHNAENDFSYPPVKMKLISETDTDELSRHATVYPRLEDPSYVVPWKKNLKYEDISVSNLFTSRIEILVFLAKGLHGHHEFDGKQGEYNLYNCTVEFLEFAAVITRENIHWDDVEQRVLDEYVRQNGFREKYSINEPIGFLDLTLKLFLTWWSQTGRNNHG